MHHSELPTTIHRNPHPRRNPLYDKIAAALRSQPERRYQQALDRVPGKTKSAKLTAVINNMCSRRLKVTTRTDGDEVGYIRITEDFGGGAR